MSESKASKSYQAFESLLSRFGGPKQSPELEPTRTLQAYAQQWREKTKRTSFASAAPPLLPLVEEGDIIQEKLNPQAPIISSMQSTPVKGKWKYSSIKSNHLNAPDCDALETESNAESVVSCADSAYSSRSESLSPITGSFSEISTGLPQSSIKTEQPVKNSKSSTVFIKQEGRLAMLKASFENGTTGQSGTCSPKANDSTDKNSVPSVVVPRSTKAWNKAIGSWVFEGVTGSPASSASSSPRLRRPSNEIRIPTPISTPVYGSTENLADSGSHSSLFSGSGTWGDDNEGTTATREEEQSTKYSLGKFVSSNARKSPVTTVFRRTSDTFPPSIVQRKQSVEVPSYRPHSTLWVEAKKKQEMLKMKKENKEGSAEESERDRGRKLSVDSTVEDRAKLFGETRPRRGLRRTQSLLVHSYSSPRTARANNSFM